MEAESEEEDDDDDDDGKKVSDKSPLCGTKCFFFFFCLCVTVATSNTSAHPSLHAIKLAGWYKPNTLRC